MSRMIAIGEAMVEVQADQLEKLAIKYVGGDVLSSLGIFAKMGGEAFLVSRVANDLFKPNYLETFKALNVKTDSVEFVDHESNGLYFIQTRDQGERVFQYYRDQSAGSRTKSINLTLNDSDILYSSGIALSIGENPRHLVKQSFVKHRGLRAFDLNFRPKLVQESNFLDYLKEIIPSIDLLFASGEEVYLLEKLFEQKGAQEVANVFLQKFHGSILCFKRGAGRVSVFSHNQETFHVTPPKVEAIDTTGAGDVFNGAFLNCFANKLELKDCAQIACEQAAKMVTLKGSSAAILAM